MGVFEERDWPGKAMVVKEMKIQPTNLPFDRLLVPSVIFISIYGPILCMVNLWSYPLHCSTIQQLFGVCCDRCKSRSLVGVSTFSQIKGLVSTDCSLDRLSINTPGLSVGCAIFCWQVSDRMSGVHFFNKFTCL